jgi:DNA-binding transcriptional ArsR family regulator
LAPEPEAIDRVFAALGHPIRRQIVAQLAATGDTCITDLAAPFQVSLMAVSKHVRILSEAGLVVVEREGRMHWCRANPDTLRLARDWLVRHYRAAID